MAFPQVQKVKLDRMKAEVGTDVKPPVQLPGPNAVASMTPGPVATTVPAGAESDMDESAFAVGHVPAEDGAVSDTPAPRREEGGRTNWEEESKENYHRWKTVAGMYEKAKDDLVSLKDEVRLLKDSLETMKKAPAPVVPAAVNLTEEELTSEETETYEKAFPVINKLSKKVAQQMINQVVAPMQEEIRSLKEGNSSVAQTIKDTDERTFYSNVVSRVPDMEKTIQLPEWKDYLSQRVPYTDYTRGQALIAAHGARNLDRVSEIFSGFKPGSPDSIDSLVTPAVNGSQNTAAILQSGGKKPNLKFSERKKASEDMRKGRISKEQFEKIDSMYKRAESENRIDYKS